MEVSENNMSLSGSYTVSSLQFSTMGHISRK